MAHRQRDYELYESGNLSPISSPGTHAPEFFTPGSPEATKTKFGYRSIPSRNISLPSTIGSSRMLGEPLERVKSREMQMLWGAKIHWFLPSSMVALLVLGLLGSLAHHWFYQSLDGKEARDQLTMVRCGTALAFFTKAMLVGSVVIAYRQRIWYSVRSRPFTLKGIDSMFAVVEDPTHFTTREIYSKAKMATAMAVITWIIPLASVLSPASLTTQLTNIEVHSDGGNCTVPTLDFSAENRNDWKKPRFRAGESLAFWNITPTYDVHKSGNTTVWYDQPSFNAVRLFTLTTMSHTFIPMTTPCYGFNCTWTVEFDGPWYNCTLKTAEELSLAVRPKSANTYASLAPQGTTMFFAENDVEEYARPQPEYLSDIPTVQGVFTNEPRVWFGWTSNTSKPENHTEEYKGKWQFHLERHIMQCELQKVHYSIDIAHVSNVQSNNITVTRGEAINKFDNTTVAPSHDPNSGYREYAAFHALGALTRKQVVGMITQDNWTEPPRTFSTVSQTKLVDPDTALAQPDLRLAFQTYFEEVVVSLLSERFLGISFNASVPCKKYRFQNNFKYERSSLWGGYAISIAMALVCIIFGGMSLQSNGITSDTTFSKIMVTTRNRTIDRLVEEYEGVCLGGDPFPKELEQTQFQFGVIDEISSQGRELKHAAFGTTEEVIPIQRGDSYARLSARGSHYQSSNSWVPRSGPNSPVNTRFARPI